MSQKCTIDDCDQPHCRQCGGHMLSCRTSDICDGCAMGESEEFPHDDCPKCSTHSVPAEGVRDQSLRGCPNCHHTWFEDLSRPAVKA